MKETKLLIIISLLTVIISCRVELKTNICNGFYGESVIIDTCKIFIPNLFTPNGDVQNDMLYVRSNCLNAIENYKLVIRSSVGRKLFETTNINHGWDGTHKGLRIKLANVNFELTGNIGSNDINIKGKISCIGYYRPDDYSVTNCEDCTTDNMWDGNALNTTLGTGEPGNIPCK